MSGFVIFKDGQPLVTMEPDKYYKLEYFEGATILSVHGSKAEITAEVFKPCTCEICEQVAAKIKAKRESK